jgi:Fic family protein
MNKIFDKIDVLQRQLHELLPMKLEDQQRLNKKFRLEFNYNSNHLEGNTLTYGETELLLIFDDTNGSHTMREYEEMKAHDVAYYLVEDWAKDNDRPLTEQSIKELNEIILVRPYWKDAITPEGQATRRQIKVGDYKEYPNSVRLQNGEIFNYTSPADTPIKMQELIDWYRQEKNMHPVEIAALLHYKFVCIHPFDDGNGRVSRLLMNYVLLSNNLPPIIIKSEDKANYLRALHLADIGAVDSFTEYIAQQVIWSLDISLNAAKGESIDESNDWKKKLTIIKKEVPNSEELKIQKSDQVVQQIIKNTVQPFITLLMTELSSFDDLFAIKQMYFQGSGSSYSISNIDGINEALSVLIENMKDYIVFHYSLQGFKKNGIKAFNVFIEVQWEFYQFTYKFSIKNVEPNIISEKLYHKQFTTEETQVLVNKCAEKLVEYIELTIKNNI